MEAADGDDSQLGEGLGDDARLGLGVVGADLLDTGLDDPDAEQRIIAEALTQLRIVSVGRLHWLADGRGVAKGTPQAL